MKPIDILLVEDNEGDIVLAIDAFEESRIRNKINVIRDGEAAVDFFDAIQSSGQIPDLVLLDINLPKISGHEVLVYLKTNEKFKSIPVIMLTTSSSEKDIALSYKNHVNCYITKPIDVADFIRAIGKIEDFWIRIATIPKK
jgi:CheY-like chemotaxis protein